MSVEIWTNPNDPKPIKTKYPIGTVGLELNKASFKILDFLYETITFQYPSRWFSHVD
jgi:hypothetical protein